ncbi:MAG: adenine-specific DNA-methyltransferase [Fusobacteriaceae bacterium]|nr:adenine-specific DNA-methyltransferase [Fusobacteriaceae bacterium]
MMKFDMKTKDLQQDNVGKIEALFHEVVTETKDEKGNIKKVVDFDKLRQILSDEIVEGPRERYGLNWVGKKEALYNANKSTSKTLRPVKEESVNFENTKNIYIEGDNLDALKIIQESYLGKIKMIYIDPPYNTGKDFIYKDNFKMNKEEYDKKSEIIDEEGNKLVQNTESNGRFHSDWLSMMYSRLKVARNLLTDDGVIFISIDDHEVHNLRHLCDEIFGEDNYVTEFAWEKKKKPSFLHRNVGKLNDYILCYVKNALTSKAFSVETTTEGKKYPFNNAGNGLTTLTFPAGSVKFNMPDGVVQPQDMSEGAIITRLLDTVHISNGRNSNSFRLEGEWRYSQTKLNEIVANSEEIIISKIPFRPNHVKKGGEVKKMKNVLSPVHYQMETNEDATQQLVDLFGVALFDNPKPVKLLKYLIRAVTYDTSDAVILDFFSGSATTAHAVMQLNAEDGGNRKFIMVQLPEPTDEKSEAHKADYINICEIGKERIRRAGEKIKEEFLEKYEKELEKLKKEENKLIQDEETQEKIKELEEKIENIKNLDTGFRTFKVDSSNMKDIYYTPEELKKENLKLFESKIKEDRTDEDLLIQIILDLGLKLDLKIEEKNINNNKIYIVEDNLLVAYFGQNIEKNLIEKIKEIKPLRVVFDEKAFKSDSTIINLEEEFKKELPDTEFVVF